MNKRTKQQIDANEIDLDIFRVAQRLESFSADHKSLAAEEALFLIRRARLMIRVKMHVDDVRATI